MIKVIISSILAIGVLLWGMGIKISLSPFKISFSTPHYIYLYIGFIFVTIFINKLEQSTTNYKNGYEQGKNDAYKEVLNTFDKVTKDNP